MHLPNDFPHTRREQYLVALPDELLTHDETLMVSTILQRVRRFYAGVIWRHTAAGLPPHPSERDVVLALAEMFAARGGESTWSRGPLARRQEPA